MKLGLSRCRKCGCVNWNAFLVEPHCHWCGATEIDWLEPTPENMREADEWVAIRMQLAFEENLKEWQSSWIGGMNGKERLR